MLFMWTLWSHCGLTLYVSVFSICNIGPSSFKLDRPQAASEWPRGVRVVRVTPSRPFGSALGVATGWPARSTVRGGTHLPVAQATDPLRPTPPASALPAPPTGTGQSTRRLRQRGGACVRGRFLAEDGIYAKYTKYAK